MRGQKQPKYKCKRKDTSAISLISLIITVIVLSILAGAVITMIDVTDIIGEATRVKIKTDVKNIVEDAFIKEIRNKEVVVNEKYADKLIYEGNGEFSYNSENVSDIEKEIFEGMNINSIEDVFEYSTYTSNGEVHVGVDGFSEIGLRKLSNGVTKFVVPSKKDGYVISDISAYAFLNEKRIEEIILPTSVVNIGKSAFSGCSNLKTVGGLENVISIASHAFYYCEKLENVSLGKTTSITPYCFYNCASLKELEIPNTVIEIRERAFQYCSKLEKVVIPNSVTTISYGVWANCQSIKEIRISGSVQSINGNCFQDSCTTDSMLYVPFTAEEGAPSGWTARWSRSKAHFIYSDGTEELDSSKKYL